jgi:hypothetical protein
LENNYKMIKNKITYFKYLGLVLLSGMMVTSCERDVSSVAVPATFPTTGEIYTDNPVGLTDEFFISIDPAEGANPEAFGTDDNEAYLGESSIRIDVPAPSDPNGNFVGGVFRDRGEGRDLTGYDALTFWARGSVNGTLGEVGFGFTFLADDPGVFQTTRQSVQLTTKWAKYVVPIPNASRLIQEKGLFFFAAGGFDVIDDIPNGNEFAWTFWLDEIRFENLGTIRQTDATIYDGFDIVQSGFQGSTIGIGGTSSSFNLSTGENVAVNTAPSYFDFENTEPSVATIDFVPGEGASINIVGPGIETPEIVTTNITATLNNESVRGSATITTTGQLPFANVPTFPVSNVKAAYSDTYDEVTVINFDPQFGGSTTSTVEFTRTNPNDGDPFEDSILLYTNNNFTGIVFPENTIDATDLAFMNVDIFVEDSNEQVEFQIRDIGTNGEINTNIFTGQPDADDADFRFTVSGLTAGEWNSIPIPLGGSIANQKGNIGAIILAGGQNFILDNIYFYVP